MVQRRDVHVAAARDPVVDDHAGDDGADEAGVGAEEGEEGGRAVDELPGHDGDGEQAAHDLPPADGEVAREQAGQVAADGDGIAGDVGGERGVGLDGGGEEDERAGRGGPVGVEDGAVEVPEIPVCLLRC